MGHLVVGEDFELVCFDVVAQPSTNNAWLSLSHDEIETYRESKNSSKPIIKEDKYSEFDKWLCLKD